MDDLSFLNEPFDVDQMADGFDINNFLKILEIPSFAATVGSECVENASDGHQLSNPSSVLTENNVVEDPTDMNDENVVASCSYFSQSTDKYLPTDTIGEKIMVYGESNCDREQQKPVENSSGQMQNAINNDSNPMQSLDTLVLHIPPRMLPMHESMIQQLNENNIDLVARKINNSEILDKSLDVEQMVNAFDIENFTEVLEIPSLAAILGCERVENASDEHQLSNPSSVLTENNVVGDPTDMKDEHAVASCSNFGQTTDKCLTTNAIGEEVMVTDESNCVSREKTRDFIENSHSSSVKNSEIQIQHNLRSHRSSLLCVEPPLKSIRNSVAIELDNNDSDVVIVEREERNFNIGNLKTTKKNTQTVTQRKKLFRKCRQRFGGFAGKRLGKGGNTNEKKSFECFICAKSSASFVSLQRHVRIHTVVKLYKCLHCQKEFSHRGNLKSHISSDHNGEKPFQCQICEKRFTTSSYKNKHIRTIHNDRKKYQKRK